MKKFFLTFSIIILFFSVGLSKVYANDAFIVYPSFNFVSEGQTYEIFVENKSNELKEYTIEPVLLEIDNDNSNLNEIDSSIKINFEDYFQINSNSIQIESNSKKSFTAKYIKNFEGYTLGISISEKLANSENISLGKKIITIFYDKNLSEDDKKSLESELILEPSIKLGSYSLSNSINTQTVLDNLSSKIIFPTGKIEIYADNKILGSISLTSEINKSIFPKKNISVSETFFDERPFWERIGEVEYKQVIKVEDITLIDSQKVYNLPIEIILFGFVILIIFFIALVKAKKMNIRKKR